MKTITLTQDQCKTIADMLTLDRNAELLCDAFGNAGDGDFAPLSALVGAEREGVGEFREGDVVRHCNLGDGWTVEEVRGDMMRLARGPEGAPHAMTALCTLLARRRWKAGEVCPVVSVGQKRVVNARGRFPHAVVDNQGGRVSPWRVRWEDGKLTEMRGEAIVTDPLAADWLAPEPVPVSR